MSIIKPVVSGVVKPIVRGITAASSRYVPNFVAASQQYGTHAPWSLTGATGRVIVTTDDTSDSSYYWAASVGGEVVNGNQVIIESPVGPITEIFRDGANYANVQPQSIRYIDDSGIQNGTYLQGNGTDLYVDLGAGVTYSGDFEVEFDFIRDNSNVLQTVISNDNEVATAAFMRVGQTTNNFSVYESGAQHDFPFFWVVGRQYKVKVSRVGTEYSLEVDGVPIGSSSNAAWGGPVTYSVLMRLNPTVGQYFASTLANITLTDGTTGGTTKYLHETPVDQGNGTALVEQTGTSSAPDAIVRNFSPSDLVAVPNNTRNYRCDESSGDRLHDSNDSTQYFSYDFNGDSYMTIPPKALVAGDTVEFDFVARPDSYAGAMSLLHNGTSFFAIAGSGDFTTNLGTYTLDGVPIVGAVQAPLDGISHTIVITVNADRGVTNIGSNNVGAEVCSFPIYNVRITAASGNARHPMNNGLATQPDVLGDGSTDGTIVGNYQQSNWASRGDNDITLINGVQRIPL